MPNNKTKPLIRISLSENDFKNLISGKVVRHLHLKGANIEFCLQDIGFKMMKELIQLAEIEQL